MNKNKDLDRIEQQVERFASFIIEEEKKQEAKLWADIELPMSYYDALFKLTKDDLGVIRKKLNVKNISQLPKQQLVSELVKQVPIHLPAVINLFDQPRYDLLKKLAIKGHLIKFSLENDQIEYFRQLGLVFSGRYQNKKVLFMPEEIRETFKKLDRASLQSVVMRNTELIQLTHGALYYYGLLDLKQLEEIMIKYTGEKIEISQYLHLLFDISSFYGEFEHVPVGFAHYQVTEPKWVRMEQEARKGLEFYSFTKEQLIRAGQTDFVDRTSFYLTFREYMVKNCRLPIEEADLLIQDILEGINNGDELGEVVHSLQQEFQIEELEQVKNLIDQLVLLMNNTRQWILKGYTPKELSSRERSTLRPFPSGRGEVIDFRTKQKVGRNDPCPCGSDKKFKKCCGK